jgi:hypothetical protein
VTDRTDPYEIIGVRRDASLAEIRISYRRSTQILAPERFASANDTVRAEAARRLAALNGAMESIEAERAAESGSALGSLSFGGPAVAPAAEPSMRSTAVVDEPPPLPVPRHEPEPDRGEPEADRYEPETRAADADVAGEETQVSEPDAVTQDEPQVEDLPGAPPEAETDAPHEPGVQAVPAEPAGPTLRARVAAAAPQAPPEPEPSAAAEGDTEDDVPAIGEETSDIPIVEPEREPEPAPRPVAAPAPVTAPRRPERPSRTAPRKRSLVPRLLAVAAVVVALAAVGAYFLLSGGSSSTPSGGQFQTASAPVTFSYPGELVARQPPRGGLLKPTFSTAVGADGANYVVVATYRISADVQSDGSAIGTGGSRLTADRFDESVDRAAERIASAQKLKATGPVQPGKAGDLIARVYTYTRPGGSSARYAFAFRGHTEYSIACFWDPAHAQQLSAACDQVMASLRRV